MVWGWVWCYNFNEQGAVVAGASGGAGAEDAGLPGEAVVGGAVNLAKKIFHHHLE